MERIPAIVIGGLGLAALLGTTLWVCFCRINGREISRPGIVKFLFSIGLVSSEILLVRWLASYLGIGGLMGGLGIALPMLGSLVACGLILSVLWTPDLGAFIFSPLTSLFDGGNESAKLKPLYSIAQARRKQGKYPEAIVEIRNQLARFPDDIEGAMLLAEIQAEDMKDLPSAEATLNHFCDRPKAPPKQVAAALNRLADWQLKLARDADAARAALQRIAQRFPDTDLAMQAAQRIARLDGAEKLLAGPQPLVVPHSEQNYGLLNSMEHLQPAEADPARVAADYVKHLEQYPLDTEIREQLAILYADHYERMDLATRELQQLIDAPHQPAKRVAHWLNLLADLQVRHGADFGTVRGTLAQIVERFPDLAVASLARSRLDRLSLELKNRGRGKTVKLGVYEQNLGLKQGRPRQ